MITLLGVGGAFTTPQYWQTNFLLESDNGKKMLIDCGSDIRHSLAERNLIAKDIDAIYLSHNHADHIGGLEWAGFSTFNNQKKIKLFINDEWCYMTWVLIQEDLVPSVEGSMKETFFQTEIVYDYFTWEEYEFNTVENLHIKNRAGDYHSFGLIIKKNGKKVYISTDSVDIKSDIIANVDICFHDCETMDFVSKCHARYEDLAKLDNELKNKIIPVHFNPNPQQDVQADMMHEFPSKGMIYNVF